MPAPEEILTKKRVVIVDDHPLLRAGLKEMINRSDGYVVVGEAGDFDEAVRLALEERPDLMTMDISLPGKSGIDAVRKIKKVAAEIKILMVTMHLKFEYVAESFRAGANGYLVKEATGSKLITALDTLMEGEHFLDDHSARQLIDNVLRGNVADRRVSGEVSEEITDERYSLLSPREQQIMRLICDGLSYRDISVQLDLKLKTVENHKNNMMKKLNVHNKMELIRYASRLGLIHVDKWQ